jgi:hypothetical protein
MAYCCAWWYIIPLLCNASVLPRGLQKSRRERMLYLLNVVGTHERRTFIAVSQSIQPGMALRFDMKDYVQS